MGRRPTCVNTNHCAPSRTRKSSRRGRSARIGFQPIVTMKPAAIRTTELPAFMSAVTVRPRTSWAMTVGSRDKARTNVQAARTMLIRG